MKKEEKELRETFTGAFDYADRRASDGNPILDEFYQLLGDEIEELLAQDSSKRLSILKTAFTTLAIHASDCGDWISSEAFIDGVKLGGEDYIPHHSVDLFDHLAKCYRMVEGIPNLHLEQIRVKIDDRRSFAQLVDLQTRLDLMCKFREWNDRWFDFVERITVDRFHPKYWSETNWQAFDKLRKKLECFIEQEIENSTKGQLKIPDVINAGTVWRTLFGQGDLEWNGKTAPTFDAATLYEFLGALPVEERKVLLRDFLALLQRPYAGRAIAIGTPQQTRMILKQAIDCVERALSDVEARAHTPQQPTVNEDGDCPEAGNFIQVLKNSDVVEVLYAMKDVGLVKFTSKQLQRSLLWKGNMTDNGLRSINSRDKKEVSEGLFQMLLSLVKRLSPDQKAEIRRQATG